MLVPECTPMAVARLGGSGGPLEVELTDGASEAVDAKVFVRFGRGGGLSASSSLRLSCSTKVGRIDTEERRFGFAASGGG